MNTKPVEMWHGGIWLMCCLAMSLGVWVGVVLWLVGS
jgi:hypothetical protein